MASMVPTIVLLARAGGFDQLLEPDGSCCTQARGARTIGCTVEQCF